MQIKTKQIVSQTAIVRKRILSRILKFQIMPTFCVAPKWIHDVSVCRLGEIDRILAIIPDVRQNLSVERRHAEWEFIEIFASMNSSNLERSKALGRLTNEV